ncbi:hypothetical protein EZV62_002769 [Acer yangbiense]|uniref:Subtilisin-like protease fibronectin type-III domain-containing protein n=1 Tax=Acer yangbiense TaxID=1000413 RepID=A0A5C7IY80_9ROSI|nr:hypothetical protein EZV62_002769 [Acer yangbiense]
MDPKETTDGEFAYGSGHINPLKAVDPGLVYETLKSDYIKMLCSRGISDKVLRSISGDHNRTCPKGLDKESPKDLNYPSMSAKLKQTGTPFKITSNRTVTNVGFPNSVYKANVSQPQNVIIKVDPAVLSFKSLNEKKSFTVTVSGSSGKPFLSSSLEWSDGKHIVRSPIVLHIVYMGSLLEVQYSLASQHLNMLQEVVGRSSLENVLVRSYTRSFNGFAAMLTDNERQKLSSMDEVVFVFPSRTLQLRTTRSWNFMGFNESISRKRNIESNIIVGVIDSGIWPESESFSDEGFGPPPKKWKGACSGGKNFTCNNKIIGARYYNSASSEISARDEEGHGSHTASTAAGNLVKDASFFGLAKGRARGGVPSARIAAYKVCYPEGCASADILSAFDDAIADGVDLITISIGGDPSEFSQDAIAIGAFHAMAKGILTVNAAGNDGPTSSSVSSVAPWLFSVAASTTDRLFVDNIILGNGKTVKGFSVNSFDLDGKKLPLVRGREVSSDVCSPNEAENCIEGCIDSSKVHGKILICENVQGYFVAVDAGAAGSIVNNERSREVYLVVSIPTSVVNSKEYSEVLSYKNSTKNPQVEILKSEAIKDSTAPVVAWFSSRGPNSVVPDILKPDISAPGVNILAAYSPMGPISEVASDKRSVKYHIVSGTSMACPHVAGAAAYVKTFHPDWSPSAIKSAIMTTAWTMNPSKNGDTEFAFGSGHINPLEAINPGLVYETLKPDYIKMLCSLGLNDTVIRSISGDNSTCPKGLEKESPKDLNYPSMSTKLQQDTPFKITFNRTVTNVGFPNSVYTAKVSQPQNANIKVEPAVLSFKSLYEKKSFTVTVTGSSVKPFLSSSLVWSDGKHNVRSPIVVHYSS